MIPLATVRILNTPVNVLDFPATSTITELAFLPGTLHLRHSKENDASWTVPFETTTQHATLWIIAVDPAAGGWVAAGVERIRPGQQDKPEGDNATDFLKNWVEGRTFGAFNNRVFQPGERIGVFVVAGNSRLAGEFTVRERTNVVEVTIPPASGQRWPPFAWVEGQDITPVPPAPAPAPPEDRDRDPNPPFVDLAAIFEQRHYAVMGEFLAIRNQLAALQKSITTAGGAFSDQGKRFEAGLKAVKAIAAQLIANAARPAPTPKKKTPAKVTTSTKSRK